MTFGPPQGWTSGYTKDNTQVSWEDGRGEWHDWHDFAGCPRGARPYEPLENCGDVTRDSGDTATRILLRTRRTRQVALRRAARRRLAEYCVHNRPPGRKRHTGSVAAASCASRNAWHRQPPKSWSRRSQLRQSSGIQSTPRYFWNAADCFPDLAKRALLDIFKRHSGQHVRGVARQARHHWA